MTYLNRDSWNEKSEITTGRIQNEQVTVLINAAPAMVIKFIILHCHHGTKVLCIAFPIFIVLPGSCLLVLLHVHHIFFIGAQGIINSSPSSYYSQQVWLSKKQSNSIEITRSGSNAVYCTGKAKPGI